jgi:undecaprenyl-diphosphatase
MTIRALLCVSVVILLAASANTNAKTSPATKPAQATMPALMPQEADIARSAGPAEIIPVDIPARPLKITKLQAAILGVVEGLTEYLPVSSTGHLILTSHFMGMTHYKTQAGPLGPLLDKDQMKSVDSFEIVIQLGAILAVLGLYRRRVGQMASGISGKDPAGLKIFTLLMVAFLPAAVVGKLLHARVEEYLFGPIPVAIALAVGGVLMIVVEHFFWTRRKTSQRITAIETLTYAQAFFIGLIQCLALWPGTSRSMVTMLAGLVIGMNMLAAAEFSFLLALPTLGAATLYSAYKDWGSLKEAAGLDGLLIGIVVSAIVAALAVKGFVKWLTRHGMMPFGVYRIILAILLAAWLLR